MGTGTALIPRPLLLTPAPAATCSSAQKPVDMASNIPLRLFVLTCADGRFQAESEMSSWSRGIGGMATLSLSRSGPHPCHPSSDLRPRQIRDDLVQDLARPTFGSGWWGRGNVEFDVEAWSMELQPDPAGNSALITFSCPMLHLPSPAGQLGWTLRGYCTTLESTYRTN